MTHYLVGEDKISLFKRRSNWDFMTALNAAEDGDIIEFEKDYDLYGTGELNEIKINKSITIIGHTEVRDGMPYISNTLPKVVVRNNAQVRLENLIICDHREKNNILNIKERSTVTLQTVIVKNHTTNGENYPIIFMNDQSVLQLNNTTVIPGTSLEKNNSICSYHSTIDMVDSTISTNILAEDTNITVNSSTINVDKDAAPIHIKRSKLSIANSNMAGQQKLQLLENSKVEIQHTNFQVGVKTVDSALSMNNAKLEFHSSNAFAGIRSTVNMDAVTLKGGSITEEAKYPCAFFEESNVDLHNVDVIQPNYTHALYLIKSKGKIGLLHACSMTTKQSSIHFKTGIIRESFFLYDNAKVTADRLEILGFDNGKINLYANKRSSLQAKEVFIGKESKPNIRLERSVEYQVEQTSLFVFDEAEQYFKIDENNHLIPIDKEVDIEFFGEKPSLQRLNDLIGIESIKEEVESFIAVAEMNKRRVDQGLSSSSLSLHSLFLGNPGTGKTSVARLIGEVLFEKGVVAKDTFIEVSRSNLVGRYIGETAIKTREVLQSALGGVLFIDEAYTLSTGGEKDFGIEAINEILSFMENHRSELVIIFAGYTDDMKRFLEMNDGLRSRIPNHFHFPDYSIEDLVQIGLIDLYAEKYHLNEEVYRELIKHRYNLSYDNSNGRWTRNINDLITKKMALRHSKQPNADLKQIFDEDLIALMD